MGYFHVIGGGATAGDTNTSTANSLGTQLTATGSANTKSGTWDQLIASTTYRSAGLVVTFTGQSLANRQFAVDIGIGGAGSEVVYAANLHSVSVAVADAWTQYIIPIPIAAGARISAQLQCSNTATTCYCAVNTIPMAMNMVAYGGIDAIGYNSGTTAGTDLSHPASNNTKPLWNAAGAAQLIASTSRRYRGLIVHVGDATAAATQHRIIDVAIGAAGSEQIIVSNLYIPQNTTNDEMGPMIVGPLPVNIPAGVRMAARFQQDVTGVGRDLTLMCYGLV